MSLTAHTAISSNFKNSRIVDVDQNYNYSISQKIGIGTSFNTKRTSNAFFILGGLKYQASSSTLNIEEIPEHITSKTSSITPDYGVMYNLKLGRKKYFFSSRVYVPINNGLYGIMENANLEFGIGIGLK